MFAGSWHLEPGPAFGLRLQWTPEIKDWPGVQEAKQVVARYRTRAVALEIARLYPADSPWQVEKRLIREGLMPALEPPRLLERMIHRGSPSLAGPPSGCKGIRRYLAPVLRLHPALTSLAEDPILRLLDPTPVSAALLTDFIDRALDSGAPSALAPGPQVELSEANRYDYLLSIALSKRLGRQDALLCALIELRRAELIGDLPAYETSLRAVQDIASTQGQGSVFEAVTGVPRGRGRSKGNVACWLLDEGLEGKLMHLSDYMSATFSRVWLSKKAVDRITEFDQYLRDRGLELDGPPPYAWRNTEAVYFQPLQRQSASAERVPVNLWRILAGR
jgi:hypothetical protein